MDQQPVLTEADRKAGAEYLRALRRLRFEPDAMCWTLEFPDSKGSEGPIERSLSIVSSMVDYAGPKAIYELLFKAYDACVTPKEVDPFNVAIYSPHSVIGELLFKATKAGILAEAADQAERMSPDAGGVAVLTAINPDGSPRFLSVALDGLYVGRKKLLDERKAGQRFQAFQHEVEAAAA